MYKTVEEYFEKEYPHLVRMLGNPGAFWPAIRANTISNKDLSSHIALSKQFSDYGLAYQASVALMSARKSGKLPNPD